MNKKKILVFIGSYLPSYRAGGPIQSIANLTGHLKNEFDISIVTSNYDLGVRLLLNSSDLNIFISKDGYRIMYLESKYQNLTFYKKLFIDHKFNCVYLNSFFSYKFSILPLWAYSNMSMKKVLAPRGELGSGALAINPVKKYLFIKLSKLLNLHKEIVWQATAETELDEIKYHFGQQSKIILAPNLSAKMPLLLKRKNKIKKQLNLFYLSRISIKKNLLGALEYLSKVNEEYNINFTIIGPIDEEDYWMKCKNKIKKLPNHILVNYLGSKPNNQITKILEKQHVLILPTQHENFGHVIMESWQNGCPVIISDQTPWRQLEDKNIGLDIQLNNDVSFTDAIEMFALMDDKELFDCSNDCFNYAKLFSENPKLIVQTKKIFS
ncbi:glycosyltransferase family 4 protein [Polaribacter sp.]|nr:glycosyltransferase family 4 protein [Polaribacter sp.]